MSDADELEQPTFTPRQWAWLRQMAAIFNELSIQVPPPAGERYTTVEFIEWLELERKARGYQHRGERDRRGPGHPSGRSLAVAR